MRVPALNPWVRQRGETATLAPIDPLPPPGTPLLSDDPDDPARQRVTLTFAGAPDTAGVFAWVNRITEGGADGRMRRSGSTGLWSTEFSVPRGTMASYRFYACTADDPAFRDGQVHFSRAVARAAVSDPADPDTRDSPFGSVLRTDGAPGLARWRRTGEPAPALAADGTLGGPHSDGSVRWRLTEPIGDDAGRGAPPRLVVLFDAGVWFDRCDLPGVLARSGPRRPVALLGIDAPAEPSARLRRLGANRDFLGAVVDLLDPARQRLGWDRPVAVWAGQSLGGLSALAAAAWFPDAVDEVLAYSPSMWWRPGLTSRPADFAGERSWIADELTAAIRDGRGAQTSVHVAVGEYEALLVEPVEALAGELAAAGRPVRSTRYAGGHDLPWWAHLLWQDLSAS